MIDELRLARLYNPLTCTFEYTVSVRLLPGALGYTFVVAGEVHAEPEQLTYGLKGGSIELGKLISNEAFPIMLSLLNSMQKSGPTGSNLRATWYRDKPGVGTDVIVVENPNPNGTTIANAPEFGLSDETWSINGVLTELFKLFPALHKKGDYPCPASGKDAPQPGYSLTCLNRLYLYDLVIHLNDRHKWTFDEVADYLVTLDLDLSMKETA